MMSCTYCGQRATVQIPSTPSDVCLTHAIEFWTGLLAYRKDRSDAFQTSKNNHDTIVIRQGEQPAPPGLVRIRTDTPGHRRRVRLIRHVLRQR